jgi:DNA-binding transcriptional MerR regulator
MWETVNEAAWLLGVTPETLRAWAEQYEYPRSRTAENGETEFFEADVQALRHALASELSIASAIAKARRRSVADGPG